MMRLFNLKSRGLVKTFTGRLYANDTQTALSYMLNEVSRGESPVALPGTEGGFIFRGKSVNDCG